MHTAAASPAGKSARHGGLDTLRGVAIVAMVAYHFAFDLQYFRLIDADPYRSPVWMVCRTLILSSFLFLSGFSFQLAAARGRRPGDFWRRWAQVAGCALLVTAGSAWMFPRSFISFGVLHAVAAMWLVSLAYTPRGATGLLAALAALAAPFMVQHPFFDSRWTDWVGLVTHKPITEDYVPLLPWIGVFWLGMLAHAQAGLRQRLVAVPTQRLLARAGQWPLMIYMLHQPLLIGALMLLTGQH